MIEDEDDLGRHLDYIHYNPVKHGLAACPRAWPYSSFHRWLKRGDYDPDWGRSSELVPRFDGLGATAME
jgi:putative transposase